MRQNTNAIRKGGGCDHHMRLHVMLKDGGPLMKKKDMTVNDKSKRSNDELGENVEEDC